MSEELTRETEEARRDAAELSRMGYAQELFRDMGGFSNFALSFSLISIITGITQLYDFGLKMGGPFEMLVGWPVVTTFSLFVALSMAELASAFPTSGAMYHWACKLGGAHWGWLTAWLNIVGLVTLVAAVDYGCAQFALPLIGVEGTSLNLLATYALILISHGLINHFGIRLVAWLNDFSVTVHMVGVTALIGALWLYAPHQSPEFLTLQQSFGDDAPKPYLFAFIVGLLQAQWTMTGYDASAQVSEETVEPRVRVPWGIVMAVVVSAVFGYIFIIMLTLSIPAIDGVLATKDASGTDVPAIIAILTRSLGPRVGWTLSALVVGTAWFCGLSAITSVSRAIYAFSRDDGMPLSSLWRRVSPRFGTPAAAIWLTVGTAFGAAVYSKALAAIISISVVAIYLSYILPVVLDWKHELSGGETLRGPWNLGRFSRPVHAVAIAWTAFITVVLVIPIPANPLTGYTLLGTLFVLGVYHVVWARHHFQGPEFLRESPQTLQA
ncbi:MAG: amino acid permease [Proteobacteria bacterium]|nr:amino acid permease [Pseudomonadota bacterium]